MPHPPLLWVSPSQQEQRSLETPKKALESPLPKQVTMVGKEQKKALGSPLQEQDSMIEALESPSKEQDMMVSMNQVLPPSMVVSGNSRSPLMDTTQADHPKVQDFVEAKGDVVSQVQCQTAVSSSQTRALKLEKETNPSADSSATSEKTVKLEKEPASPTLDFGPPSVVPKKTNLPALLGQGPPSAAPKKTNLPALVNQGPLTAQPSAPPPAVVSQQFSQVL